MSAFKKRRREFETPECVSCGSDNVVTDTKQGHMVCDDCGVILEASMISASTEYRNFSESDKPTGDPTRVAAGPLGTSMAAQQGFSRRPRVAGASGQAEERFRAAFKIIADTVTKLDLDQDVREAAQELYSIYAGQREKVSDVRAASAAAVFRACKERGCGRTIKELNKVLDPTVNMKKSISKADRDLKRTLQERVQEEARRHGVDVSDFKKVNDLIREQGGLGALLAMPETDRAAGHPSQQVPRFGSDLGFSSRGIQIAKKISRLILPDDLTEKLEHRPWHGKQPITLTAVTLYIATHLGPRTMLPGVGVCKLSQVAEACGVSPSTIEATFAELHAELQRFIPSNIKPPLTAEEWAALPAPNKKMLPKRDAGTK